jgi:hypothetical protein
MQEEKPDSNPAKYMHSIISSHKFRRIETLIVLSIGDDLCGNNNKNDDDGGVQSSGFGCLYDEDKESLLTKDYLPHFFNDVVDKGIILDSVQSCAEFVPARESFISGINLPCSQVDSTVIIEQRQVKISILHISKHLECIFLAHKIT